VPDSWSGGRDLAAGISAELGSLLLALLLRWSEGRVEKETDALSNKGVAVIHLLQCDRGGRRLSLAGLGGEGGKAHSLASIGVEELLAGRGGEEEHSCVFTTSTAYSWTYASGAVAVRRSCSSRSAVEARARTATGVLLRGCCFSALETVPQVSLVVLLQA
jgi:hypothetical protein